MQLTQGIPNDPCVAMVDFAARDFLAAIKRCADREPWGYVIGLNVYAVLVDEALSPIKPMPGR